MAGEKVTEGLLNKPSVTNGTYLAPSPRRDPGLRREGAIHMLQRAPAVDSGMRRNDQTEVVALK